MWSSGDSVPFFVPRRGGRLCARFLLLLAAWLPALPASSAPATRFALLVPAPPRSKAKSVADPNRQAYARVLESVAAPHTDLRADASPEALRRFSALVAPARTARALDPQAVERILAAVRGGALLVTEEDTPLARALDVGFGTSKVQVEQVEDALDPRLTILWEKPAEVPRVLPPKEARVLAKEKWSGAPLVLAFREGRGCVLYLAAELDPLHGEGYGRFPYLLHALVKECGLRLPFRSPRLHAFFDYGYRSSADLEYLARRWRRNGIQALHVAAWQFFDRTLDDYLRRLLADCHRNGILVYAWFELPHVSEEFWQQHPEWREKTATLQDARVDWRSLVNLLEPAAFDAVSRGMLGLLADFDWDGVNVAELYFESPLGPVNTHRFTPMNDRVRAEFQAREGWDPADLFRHNSPRYWRRDPASWQRFVEYRVELVKRLHEKFLSVVEEARRAKPYLDLAVTFLDNLHDPRMREALGTDAQTFLPLADRFHCTLIVEDPFTLWTLGPSRYRRLGERYRALAPGAELGVDINIVERWQEVFPTRQQTGAEFLQLLHYAGEHFSTVLVYIEQSVYPQDMEMVPYALAGNPRLARTADRETSVELPRSMFFHATAARKDRILVEGKDWPARENGDVLLPAGRHTVQVKPGEAPEFQLHRLTAELLDADYEGPRALRFRYRSTSRAAAVFSARPEILLLDGQAYPLPPGEAPGESTVLLPPGEHKVRARF